ncbi:hypothetical protein PMAYCL1PPCAC_01302 [Pristionchus mayeri]|uniref:BTB domain-containing protein n=1 Tax=Pristionchus mayeri TaxID=1317129 RepID=A0AAN4Z4A1_9BILA|nr:hypothetical protein PMAYCL1PPCAC_01302 [Pristionchus mayeri]
MTIRIDGYYPLIFKRDNKISSVDFEVASKWAIWENLQKYSLIFHLRKSAIPLPRTPLLCLIYTGNLKAESTTIAVSAELLGIHSEYFTNIFFGEYLERTQEVKEIGEIAAEEFVNFIRWVHNRNEKLLTIKGPGSTLETALP